MKIRNFFYIQIFLIIMMIAMTFSCASLSLKNDDVPAPDVSSEVQEKKEKTVIEIQKIAEVEELTNKDFPEKVNFREVWAYVLDGREAELKAAGSAVTDVGYFGATLDTFGDLVGVPKRDKLNENPGVKVHMVIVDSSRSLTHFCISRQYTVRNQLLNQIVKAAKPYDGVQIDFELVSSVDAEDYYAFLTELKRRLPKKEITIAVPARTKRLKTDAYDYYRLREIVDRIVVMAYDEHWSTSVPGPVASIRWCENIMRYSMNVIPSEKLIMGAPFYGRCWNTDDTAGAYKFTSVERVQNQTKQKEIKRINGIPTFQVKKEVVYQFYYDDLYSMKKRLKMYEDAGVQNVSFWRLGQEDVKIWEHISIKE